MIPPCFVLKTIQQPYFKKLTLNSKNFQNGFKVKKLSLNIEKTRQLSKDHGIMKIYRKAYHYDILITITSKVHLS